ncbi:Hypothetical predicted protein [Paramuricea clavata]|uniref:Uncharacterized protein n=1 Tax=Paramuricea clavata TaxID=317549 RepID=A0A7D9JY85_PARCT|nr:Hypothetical predicted protein [Paramuricea clavata]
MADSDTAIVGLAIIARDLAKRLKRRQRKWGKYFFRRKKKMAILFLRLSEIYLRRETVLRRFWQEPSRGKSLFWERTASQWVDDNLWVENFRMSKNSFLAICRELSEVLHKKDTRFRKAITLEKRVAVCLWHLATGEDMRSLGWRFDIGKSTACQIVNDVCEAIAVVLLQNVIKWPTGEALKSVLKGFKEEWQFPQCAGAIDGTHVPIAAPSEYPSNYYNRKCFYSIIMQAVVDHAYRFIDIYIKWPGKVHDARVFSNSSLFHKGQQGQLFPNWTENIGNCEVPITLIGDAAYPLLPWLIKGFQDDGNLSRSQIQFNRSLSSARMVVEGAFGRLKCRFRCLLKRNDTSLQKLPVKIAACCALHNICEMNGKSLTQSGFRMMLIIIST